MMADTLIPTPKEITRANANDLKIIWQDGHESIYPAKALRLACPCAGCVDEVTGQRRIIPPPAASAKGGAAPTGAGPAGMRAGGGITARAVPEDVKPLKVELVGRYAMSVTWSDFHRTGIYAFDYLRKLCPCCSSVQRTADSV